LFSIITTITWGAGPDLAGLAAALAVGAGDLVAPADLVVVGLAAVVVVGAGLVGAGLGAFGRPVCGRVAGEGLLHAATAMDRMVAPSAPLITRTAASKALRPPAPVSGVGRGGVAGGSRRIL
jgi:hypothetical protein